MTNDNTPTLAALREAQAMHDNARGFFSTNQLRLRQEIKLVVDTGDTWLLTPKPSTRMPTCDLFMPFEISKITLRPYL